MGSAWFRERKVVKISHASYTSFENIDPKRYTMAKAPRNRKKTEPSQARVSIYAAWCKRCGNCVEFCPTHALEWDELGYPRLGDPEKCTSCHLCEKLCPDFAIGVMERPPREESDKRITHKGTETANLEEVRSPERVAPPVPAGNDTVKK